LSRRLHEREEFYRSILESLDEGVITDREPHPTSTRASNACPATRAPSLTGAVSHELLAERVKWLAMRRRLKERLAGKEGATSRARSKGEHHVSCAPPYRTRAATSLAPSVCLVHQGAQTLEFENEHC
jgi:hypothetical protein